MLSLLRRLVETYKALFSRQAAPWRLSLTDIDIEIDLGREGVRRMPLADLRRVEIVTDDSGPWGDDLFWFLFGDDERPRFAWPQGTEGEKAVIDYLLALSGFDFEAMIKAQTSTDHATFVVWAAPST